MTSWQKRVRRGLATFGIVFAGLVYWSVRERPAPDAPAAVNRLDPKALLETTAAILQQVRGIEQEFQIKSARTLSYEDGSARHFDVEITVRKGGGRSFVITATEAHAGPSQVQLELTGNVTLSADDGFRLLTERATFNQDDGVARVPGELTFAKGRMSGSGLGATYDQRNDVLQLAQRAAVGMTDESGSVTLDATAGTASLDRLQDVLFLDSAVHVLRGAEVIDADRAMANLSEGEDVITKLELRGSARVRGGGGPIESMRASAIDLDYTDDGTTLERVVLNGEASVAMAADEQAAGRQMSGESLDLQLAGDGSLTALIGRERVRLDLPAAGGTAGRSIRARRLDATGEPGRGLTVARFVEQVVYREEGARDVPSREARSQSLNASLEGDSVTAAFFTGSVTFEDQGLRAAAAQVSYQPGKGLLRLSGSDAGGGPSVTDEQIRVEAQTIDVALDGHAMTARGDVRTSLSGRREREGGSGQLPSLLRQADPVSVNADALEYRGAAGRAEYSGQATLVQGDTAIRGDLITLDRQKGDLVAAGSARSSLILDNGRTDGRADEIRYDEAARVLTYSPGAIAPTSQKGPAPTAAARPAAAGRLAQLVGPQGDLRAGRIEIVLARDRNEVERLEGYDRVTMTQGARTAAGARLTYHAREERYVMSGAGVMPVTIREACRETTGRTLTFFKSTDRIVVDGDGTGRTETRPCASEPSR